MNGIPSNRLELESAGKIWGLIDYKNGSVSGIVCENNTNEQILHEFTIPAEAYQVWSFIVLHYLAWHTNSANTKTIKIYINDILINTWSGTTQAGTIVQKQWVVKEDQRGLYGRNPATTNQGNDFGGGLGGYANIYVGNKMGDLNFKITGQKAVATEELQLRSCWTKIIAPNPNEILDTEAL